VAADFFFFLSQPSPRPGVKVKFGTSACWGGLGGTTKSRRNTKETTLNRTDVK
jgi:hypothetical protein